MRKDALVARHVEGRDSHDLDYIFNDPVSKPLPKINEEAGLNFLD